MTEKKTKQGAIMHFKFSQMHIHILEMKAKQSLFQCHQQCKCRL